MPDDLHDPKITVTLEPEAGRFVQGLVEAGEVESVAAAVAQAIALLREHRDEVEELRAALIEGEESGFIDGFDPDAFLKDLHERHKARA